MKDGAPVNDACDLQFSLWDALSGGSQVGPTLTRTNVPVSGGLFTVADLDFGSGAFGGDARWLAVAVECSGEPGLTPLSPRQALTAAPYASFAAQVGAHDHLGQTWTGADNPLAIGGSFAGPGAAPLILSNSSENGLVVTSAGANGLAVGTVGGAGVSVEEGVYGLLVLHAGWHGVEVGTADYEGVRVDNAGRHGIYVVSATDDGVRVDSASDGVQVSWASDCGVQVDQAGDDGVQVDQAGDDGVHVVRAGNPSQTIPDPTGLPNGLEVEGAEGHGLYVGRAGRDGLRVVSSGSDGVSVVGAGFAGVYVWEAGYIGVFANTTQPDHEWGFYTPDKIYSGGGLAAGGPAMIVAQNGDVGELVPGDVVAVSGVGARSAGGDVPAPLVRRAGPGGAVAGVVYARFVVEQEVEKQGEGQPEQRTRLHSRSTEGPVPPGEYLLLVVLGQAQVRASAAASAITPGDLLVAAGEGQAARLGDDYRPGSMIGTAMEGLDAAQDSGLIWVLVSPR